MQDRTGNLPPLPGIFPDYSAPIVRNQPGGRELTHGEVGNAVACVCAQGPEFRFRRHRRSQCQLASLATLARDLEPLRGAVHELCRK
jgi:hypothetical protein